MLKQEEHGFLDALLRDHMIVVQDEDNVWVDLLKLSEQVCQDGRDRGGLWRVEPTVGKLVRSAAMTEVQNRVGSLSSASSESQAKTVWGAACHSLALPLCTAATQAESRVVLPLPAEALTSVKG
jgi:hypothetical protein